ncbi:MAG: hypothetical protein ACLF0G_04495 [Candidatus Brocadiia bacterium]
MQRSTIAIAAALLAAGGAAFLAGRAGTRRKLVPAVAMARPATVGAQDARSEPPAADIPASRAVREAPAGNEQRPQPLAAPEPAERTVCQTFEDDELEVKVEKPKSTDWTVSTKRTNFRDPVRHPAKVLEMRRNPRSGEPKFAIIELFVAEIPSGSTAWQEVERFEKLGRRGVLASFEVVEEGTVRIGGRAFTRRVSLCRWRGRREQAKFLSVHTVLEGKLYLLMGYASAEHFDELLPEFEQAFASLEIG